MMKKFIVFAALTALSACSQKAEDNSAAPTADAAPAVPADMVGVFDVKMANGKMGTTVIDANGTYVDTGSDGQTVKGRFAARNGQDCFDPEGDDPEECWTKTVRAADGSFTATAPDGTRVMVTPKAATPAT